jgi:hypothetical protein
VKLIINKKTNQNSKTINAMKKIFLLTLLSVFLLSAFSQNTAGTTEIISQVTLNKYIDDDEVELAQGGLWGFFRMFFYKNVTTIVKPDGSVQVNCSGWGFKWCRPVYRGMLPDIAGVDAEVMASTCEKTIDDYDQQVANGVPVGSVSKKMAFSDPRSGRAAYLIFQVNWNHDPQKPYNGRAEITILKTNDLGF